MARLTLLILNSSKNRIVPVANTPAIEIAIEQIQRAEMKVSALAFEPGLPWYLQFTIEALKG
jgi:hypothetical protein